MTRKRFVKLLMSYNYSRNEAYQTAYILVDEDVGFKSYLEAYNYLLQKNLNQVLTRLDFCGTILVETRKEKCVYEFRQYVWYEWYV